MLINSPKAINIKAQRESLGNAAHQPLVEGEQHLFVAYSDGNIYFNQPSDSRWAILSVTVGDIG